MLNRSFHWATFAVIPMLVGPSYLDGHIEFGVISQASLAESGLFSLMFIVVEKEYLLVIASKSLSFKSKEKMKDIVSHWHRCTHIYSNIYSIPIYNNTEYTQFVL